MLPALLLWLSLSLSSAFVTPSSTRTTSRKVSLHSFNNNNNNNQDGSKSFSSSIRQRTNQIRKANANANTYGRRDVPDNDTTSSSYYNRYRGNSGVNGQANRINENVYDIPRQPVNNNNRVNDNYNNNNNYNRFNNNNNMNDNAYDIPRNNRNVMSSSRQTNANFVRQGGVSTQVRQRQRIMNTNTPLRELQDDYMENDNNYDYLQEETPGGYTVKQRLREEVENPFRKVRLALFGFSTISASVALYFSSLSTIKSYVGGYSDAPPLTTCWQNDAINLGAVLLSAFLVQRDLQAGDKNLQRIQTGGQLAALPVEPMSPVFNYGTFTLADYRRQARVLICAGGESYLRRLALSLTSDQLSDTNILPQRLAESDVLVVPVLLRPDGNYGYVVSRETKAFWNRLQSFDLYDETFRPELGRNFDITRAQEIIAFPRNAPQWQDVLDSEIDTAASQGFDVFNQGITLTIKKNGKILRRATGLPPWGELIATLEVADGSRFGMPGDSQIYGGR